MRFLYLKSCFYKDFFSIISKACKYFMANPPDKLILEPLIKSEEFEITHLICFTAS